MNSVSLPAAAVKVPVAAPTPAGENGTAQRKALQRQAVSFEAVYLGEMLKPMFDGLATDGPFSGGFGEDVWRSLQVQEFGKAIAASGGIGLAAAVHDELLAAQETGAGRTR
ncbi:MAG: rod-binding protein [Rhodospirillales bacterium]|nr:rod-binding protein [Rhodospirillales bacterium]